MTDVHDTAPLDTAQLRSWARWCPGQTNLMCLNHLLHRAADEIDRLRDAEAERDAAVAGRADYRRCYETTHARLAAVEALCDRAGDVNCEWLTRVRAAARGEGPDA